MKRTRKDEDREGRKEKGVKSKKIIIEECPHLDDYNIHNKQISYTAGCL